MVQELTTQPSVFGRLGKGLAQGLADTVPKEIERNRMATGLKRFAQESGGRNQMENLAELASIPGVLNSPQLLKSYTDLARQQSIINSTNQQGQTGQPNQKQQQNITSSGIPLASPAQQSEATPQSVTTKEGVRAALNPYIPPNAQEKEAMARQRMANEPLVYPDIETARASIDRDTAAEKQRSDAEIQARDIQQNVQTRAEQELVKEISRLGGGNLPGTILSDLEDKAIEAVRTGQMSEKDAAKKFGKEAQEIDRDINKMKSWGDVDLITNKPNELLRAIDNVKNSFHKRGYKREFQDLLVSENGVTPKFAAALDSPVKEHKELNNFIKSIPELKEPKSKLFQGVAGVAGLLGLIASPEKDPYKYQETLKISPQIAKFMGDADPLSIAYELDKKGYASDAFLEYIDKNQKKLDLKQSQIDQFKKTDKTFYGWLNDYWLKSFTGIE